MNISRNCPESKTTCSELNCLTQCMKQPAPVQYGENESIDFSISRGYLSVYAFSMDRAKLLIEQAIKTGIVKRGLVQTISVTIISEIHE